MPKEIEKPSPAVLSWAAGVWTQLSAVECVAVLWAALQYDVRSSPESFAYIDRMSLLPWLSLGEPLQQDIARALQQLRTRLQ